MTPDTPDVILYADRTFYRREFVAARLRNEGFEVRTCATPDAVPERVDDDVDCLVVHADRRDGGVRDAVEAVRADHPDLRIVVHAPDDADGDATLVTGDTDALVDAVRGEGDGAVHGDDDTAAVRDDRNPTGVYERVTDAVLSIDEDFRYTFVSENASEMLGVDPSDLLGQCVWDVFPDMNESDFGPPLREAMAEQETRHVEGYYEPLDQWFAVRFYPAEEGVTTFFRDVTDRRARELELQSERDRASALFTNTNDCIVFAEFDDGTPLIRDVNPAFEETFGFHREDVVGESLDDVVVPAEDLDGARELNRRTNDGEVVERAVRRRTATGLRDFLLRSVPIETDDGYGEGYAVYTDITDRRERQQRLQVLSRVLRHNLRNDMNVVLGVVDSVLADVDDPDVEEQLRIVREVGHHLLDRSTHAQEVEGTVARIADRGVTMDVSELVTRQVDALCDRYPDAVVETDLADDALVSADPALETAVEELLTNAVVHNDRETPTVTVSVTADEDHVRLAVTDDGPGIPEEEQGVLVRGEETPLHHSSGLGLWLVNWIVRASGGDLSFESADPRGSRVIASLPRETRA